LPNLLANWPAPPTVSALTTTKRGGNSLPPYDGNNLALHVGDDECRVLENRRLLSLSLSFQQEPIWLTQTHSTRCVVVEDDLNREADAAVTRKRQTPLCILTADCLPIVLCDEKGTEIAAIHAGWRGLAYGIIENTLKNMQSTKKTLMAWIGPAICQKCYEVGEELETIFTSQYPFTKDTFINKDAKRYANLAKMAELILNVNGIDAVYPSKACSFELKNDFYSYRHASQTGRMATIIWLK